MDSLLRSATPYLLLGAGILVPAAGVAQESFPTRTVRMITPIPAGSGTDTVARMIADRLSERLGQRVLVENRPGAGTIIGNDAVAKSKPDGYTVLVNGAALTIAPSMYKKIPYDTARDFEAVTIAVVSPNVMAVHPSLPARTVKELIALARARPDQILFSSGGRGVNSHLATELFVSMAQVRMLHVPYKGSTPGVHALLAGEVALMNNSLATLLPHIRAGRLRALGVGGATRSSAAPEIPTIGEVGLPGYEAVQWVGYFVPAGSPRDIVLRLNREVTAVVRDPVVEKRLAEGGNEIVGSTPEAADAFFRAELLKWPAVVKAAGLLPE